MGQLVEQDFAPPDGVTLTESMVAVNVGQTFVMLADNRLAHVVCRAVRVLDDGSAAILVMELDAEDADPAGAITTGPIWRPAAGLSDTGAVALFAALRARTPVVVSRGDGSTVEGVPKMLRHDGVELQPQGGDARSVRWVSYIEIEQVEG